MIPELKYKDSWFPVLKTKIHVLKLWLIIHHSASTPDTVKSWDELLSANTNKLKSSNSLSHRAKPKRLEVDSATGSWTSDNRRPVRRLDRQIHGDQRPVPGGQFRYEEADTRIVLHTWYARRNDSVMHCDTLTLTLMSLSYCLLITKTWLWKGETWKREESRTFYTNRPRQC